MSKATYRLACLEAKPRLARILDIPYDLNGSILIDAGGVGVYVACAADMGVRYVGSVHRPTSPHGLTDRIMEHRLKSPERRAAWRYVWFVPMHTGATLAEVRRAEARIGAMLRPPMTQRLPIG
jgi:hypothetical protein